VSLNQRINADALLAELNEPMPEVNVSAALSRVVWRQRAAAAERVSLWSAKPRYVSMGVHAGLFALLVFGAATPAVQDSVRERFNLIDPNLKPYLTQGGGGGGPREEAPVTAGKLPKPAPKQFTPPQVVDRMPILAMEPNIVAPPDVPLPQSSFATWGDPLAKVVTGSNGFGSGGGMGEGTGGGIGPGHGPGAGPGDGGGIGGAVFYPGGGVTMPKLLFQVEPDYSDDARRARFSGTVTLSAVVDASGKVRDIHVLRSPGLGLDEKAIEAVSKWRFRPGLKDGRPVNVRAQVEVSFRLL
jgi:protein TonB